MPGRKFTCTGMGNSHFITFSTYGRRNLLQTPASRLLVVAALARIVESGRVKVTGFVVMHNHVHALLWFNSPDAALPRVMNAWKSSSSKSLKKYFDEKLPGMTEHLSRERDGRKRTSFWQTRYYQFNILTHKKIIEKLDYNPVKKGLCEKPEDWVGSSAAFYLLRKDVGVEIDPGL